MKQPHSLLILLLAAAAPVIGYFLADMLFSKAVIDYAVLSGSDRTWAQGIIWSLGLQLICGAPVVYVMGVILALLAGLANQRVKLPANRLLAFVAILGFAAGFTFYFPWQFFLLLSAAL